MAPRKPKEAPAEKPLLAVVADVHIGNHAKFGGPVVDGLNDRARVTLEAFRRAIDAAKVAGVKALFVAGDLFHNRRPEPAIIASVQRLLHEAAADLPVVIVPGNHDMLDATCSGGNTACAPLWQEASVCLEPAWYAYDGLGVLAVPFDSTKPMADHLAAVLSTAASGAFPRPEADRYVLVTHVGVWSEDGAPPWMKRARDGMDAERLRSLMSQAAISEAYVGNYHQFEQFTGKAGLTVTQVGTLNPGGFGDAGREHRGYMALTSGRGPTMVEVPGPRFVVLRDGDALTWKKGELCSFYVRHEGAARLAPAATKQLAGYEFHPPPAQHAEARPGGAREELSEEAAIAAYVSEMTLPKGVDAAGVLDLVRDCWRKSA